MKRYLWTYLFLFALCIYNKDVHAQSAAKITAGEYFYDVDPGTGNATAINVTTADSLALNLNLPAANLIGGFHQMFIRFKDATGLWSIAEQRTFYIDSSTPGNKPQFSAGEYFFDKDPGVGQALKFGGLTGDSIIKTYNWKTTGLKPGFHQLFLRYRDANVSWSIAEQRTFYIDKDTIKKPAPIIAGEYFFGTDPGVGKGKVLTVTKTDSINQTFAIVAPTATGKKYVQIRFKDSTGKWSIAESRQITIKAALNAESEIIAASPKLNDVQMKLYPNPAGNNTTLLFFAEKEQKIFIQLVSINGAVKLNKLVNAIKGENKILLDLNQLAAGAYIVNISNDAHEQKSITLIKQ